MPTHRSVLRPRRWKNRLHTMVVEKRLSMNQVGTVGSKDCGTFMSSFS